MHLLLLFLHPTLLAPGIKSCGTLSSSPGPLGVDLCFPFGWQRIWDLLGSSRQGRATSGTRRGGGGRSLFVPWLREVGATQLPWTFLFLAQRQLEPGRLPGKEKPDPRGRREENPNPGWAGTGITGACVERWAQERGEILPGGCCDLRGVGGDAQVAESCVTETSGLTGGTERPGRGPPHPPPSCRSAPSPAPLELPPLLLPRIGGVKGTRVVLESPGIHRGAF